MKMSGINIFLFIFVCFYMPQQASAAAPRQLLSPQQESFLDLPNEVWYEILHYLGLLDAVHLGLTSSRLYDLLQQIPLSYFLKHRDHILHPTFVSFMQNASIQMFSGGFSFLSSSIGRPMTESLEKRQDKKWACRFGQSDYLFEASGLLRKLTDGSDAIVSVQLNPSLDTKGQFVAFAMAGNRVYALSGSGNIWSIDLNTLQNAPIFWRNEASSLVVDREIAYIGCSPNQIVILDLCKNQAVGIVTLKIPKGTLELLHITEGRLYCMVSSGNTNTLYRSNLKPLFKDQ